LLSGTSNSMSIKRGDAADEMSTEEGPGSGLWLEEVSLTWSASPASTDISGNALPTSMSKVSPLPASSTVTVSMTTPSPIVGYDRVTEVEISNRRGRERLDGGALSDRHGVQLHAAPLDVGLVAASPGGGGGAGAGVASAHDHVGLFVFLDGLQHLVGGDDGVQGLPEVLFLLFFFFLHGRCIGAAPTVHFTGHEDVVTKQLRRALVRRSRKLRIGTDIWTWFPRRALWSFERLGGVAGLGHDVGGSSETLPDIHGPRGGRRDHGQQARIRMQRLWQRSHRGGRRVRFFRCWVTGQYVTQARRDQYSTR
jgi:hypothetical protein